MKNLVIAFTFICITFGLKAQENLGPDSIRTNYLAAQKKIGKAFSDMFYPNFVKVHQLTEKDFTTKIDSAANQFYTLLNTYKEKLPPAYVAAQQFEIKMYFDKILIEFPDTHETYSNERPRSYPIIENKIKGNQALFNDPSLLENSDLVPFIQAFLNYKIAKEMNKPVYRVLYNKRLYAQWHLMPKYFENQQCRSFYRYRLLMDHISHNGIKYTAKLFASFKQECRDTALVAKLERVYRDSENDLKDHRVVEYKKIGNYGLDLHIFEKGSAAKKDKKPLIVFFHGGSWSEGQASWHFQACRKYAEKGWIACSVEYRIYGSQGTLPFAAVMDARSAIRWLRQHGNELRIDTGRIVATGNSAGGHLVLATALADGWNEKTDNLKFSPVPNVLLVNSGVYDLTDQKTAWIRKSLRNKDLVKGISPNNLIRKHLPPTLLIHSAADRNVPYASAQKFASLMQAAGNPIEFKTIQEGSHFIFDHPSFTPTVFAWRKEFLKRLGYPDSDGE
ncbi:alpha/beta hydrolase [Pedobacter sp. UBA5917]|uniref:alpha/beta hydrolase n=1 Tax=Pedobacter sp. UBA5917 TaxID=1947061 RepID=UPI0025EBE338|nr:alpha/beta hydrolase [Pedobacter sp. UBA5917]